MRHSIIPVFIPHQGCPHQCVFCNQTKITGVSTTVTPDEIHKQINNDLARIPGQLPEIAYYGGSFTALPLAMQRELLLPAYELLQEGRIASIRVSTRPDAITPDILTHLRMLGVTTVEIGAQSMDDTVLKQANRGHNRQQVCDAVNLLKEYGFQCGIQLMIGLPGEDWKSLISSAQQVSLLQPDFIRLYPVLVIDKTPLADDWRNQSFTALSIEKAVRQCAYLKVMLEYRQRIPVIRLGLQPNDFLEQPGTILAGPYHPSFGEMVDAYIFYLMLAHVLEKVKTDHLIILHHPKDHSKLRGLKNSNIHVLRAEFRLKRIDINPSGYFQNELILLIHGNRYVINPQMLFYI